MNQFSFGGQTQGSTASEEKDEEIANLRQQIEELTADLANLKLEKSKPSNVTRVARQNTKVSTAKTLRTRGTEESEVAFLDVDTLNKQLLGWRAELAVLKQESANLRRNKNNALAIADVERKINGVAAKIRGAVIKLRKADAYSPPVATSAQAVEETQRQQQTQEEEEARLQKDMDLAAELAAQAKRLRDRDAFARAKREAAAADAMAFERERERLRREQVANDLAAANRRAVADEVERREAEAEKRHNAEVAVLQKQKAEAEEATKRAEEEIKAIERDAEIARAEAENMERLFQESRAALALKAQHAEDLRKKVAEDDDRANAEEALAIIEEDVAEGADEDDDQEAKDRKAEKQTEAEMTLDVHFPAETKFTKLTAAGKMSNATLSDYAADMLYDPEPEMYEWEPREGDIKRENTLRIKANPRAIFELVEHVVGPLFAVWATAGEKGGIQQSALGVRTFHWTNTVIPFLTQVAIVVCAAQEMNMTLAKELLNRSLQEAFDKFCEVARFIVVKALIGFETGDFDENGKFIGLRGSMQELGPEARSALLAFPIVAEDRSVKATLLTQTKKTKNQLLRYDKPPRVTASNGDFTGWRLNDEDKGRQTHGMIASPLVKMIFTNKPNEGVVASFNENGKPLFKVTSEAEKNVLNDVDFKSIIEDMPPAVTESEKGKKTMAHNTQSAKSLESFISRVYGLPLLTALFIDQYTLLEDVNIAAYTPQQVGDGIPTPYYSQMPLLPMFFPKGTFKVDEKTYKDNTGKKGTRINVSINVNKEGQPKNLAVGGNTGTIDLVQKEGADAGLVKHLSFLTVIYQIANVAYLYDWDNTSVTVETRMNALLKIIAASFFTPVKYGVLDQEPPLSLFQRYGRRPRFYEDNGEPEYFWSNARAKNGGGRESKKSTKSGHHGYEYRSGGEYKTVTSEFSFKSLAKSTLAKLTGKTITEAILSYTGSQKNQILTYKKWLTTEFDGKLAAMINDPHETPRTVLVPTDKALRAFMQTGAFTFRVGKGDPEQFIYRTLLFHVLQGLFEFEEMRKDRTSTKAPTELVIDKGNVVHMEIRVARYSASQGGSIEIGSHPVTMTVGPVHYAKNGVFYIIDGVGNVFDAEQDELGRNDFPTFPSLPPPVVGRSEEEEDWEEEEEEEGQEEQTRQSGNRPDYESSSKDYVNRLTSKKAAAEMRESYDRANGLAADMLESSRVEMARRNREDFEPWRLYLERVGLLSAVHASPEQLRLFVPTPESLAESNIDLATAPAALGEAHIERLSKSGMKAITVPTTAAELRILLARKPPTEVDTLHKNKTITYTSVPHYDRTHKINNQLEGKITVDDIQFRQPAHTVKSIKTGRVHEVHFVNRVLHPSLASKLVKGGRAAAATTTTKNKTTTTVKSKASAAPTKASSALAGKSWHEKHADVAKTLRTTKVPEKYATHIDVLDAHLNELGNAAKLLDHVSADEIKEHMSLLRDAVRSNQYVDVSRKKSAHEAINLLSGRFGNLTATTPVTSKK